VTVAKVVDVIFIRLDRAAIAFHFNPADGVGHFAFVEYHGTFSGQKRNQVGEPNHVRTKVGFEFGIAGEHHDGMKILGWQIKQRLQCLDMPVILVERVLEAGFFPVNRVASVILFSKRCGREKCLSMVAASNASPKFFRNWNRDIPVPSAKPNIDAKNIQSKTEPMPTENG